MFTTGLLEKIHNRVDAGMAGKPLLSQTAKDRIEWIAEGLLQSAIPVGVHRTGIVR